MHEVGVLAALGYAVRPLQRPASSSSSSSAAAAAVPNPAVPQPDTTGVCGGLLVVGDRFGAVPGLQLVRRRPGAEVRLHEQFQHGLRRADRIMRGGLHVQRHDRQGALPQLHEAMPRRPNGQVGLHCHGRHGVWRTRSAAATTAAAAAAAARRQILRRRFDVVPYRLG